MRASAWMAIIVGGAVGAGAALARRTPEPEPVRTLAPLPEPAAAKPAKAPEPTPPPSATAAPSAASSAAVAASRAPVAPAVSLPEVTSREELTRLEVACQEKKESLACRTAAKAYEVGKVVSADPAKVRLLRRIELTFLVRGCESQDVQSCLDLAELYRTGDGVAQSAKNEKALIERAKELCAIKKASACDTLR